MPPHYTVSESGGLPPPACRRSPTLPADGHTKISPHHIGRVLPSCLYVFQFFFRGLAFATTISGLIMYMLRSKITILVYGRHLGTLYLDGRNAGLALPTDWLIIHTVYPTSPCVCCKWHTPNLPVSDCYCQPNIVLSVEYLTLLCQICRLQNRYTKVVVVLKFRCRYCVCVVCLQLIYLTQEMCLCVHINMYIVLPVVPWVLLCRTIVESLTYTGVKTRK